MDYQWNNRKAQINFRKHGIRFADAVSVFHDDAAITIEDSEHREEEDRHITIGMDAFGQILVVVYTWRDHSIRIISARKATAHERSQYKENYEN